ncbi:hypothetical protein MTO96_022181 [Rhipicephalus appendiculatus]
MVESPRSCLSRWGASSGPEWVARPKSAEEPTPPLTTRIALGTLLVIAVVSAVTLTLGWLDWPFLPGDSYGHQGLSRNGSTDAHRHGRVVVRAALVDNDTIDEGLVPASPAKSGTIAGSTIVPHVRTLDDALDDTSSFSAEDDSEAEVTLDEAFADSSTAELVTEA